MLESRSQESVLGDPIRKRNLRLELACKYCNALYNDHPGTVLAALLNLRRYLHPGNKTWITLLDEKYNVIPRLFRILSKDVRISTACTKILTGILEEHADIRRRYNRIREFAKCVTYAFVHTRPLYLVHRVIYLTAIFYKDSPMHHLCTTSVLRRTFEMLGSTNKVFRLLYYLQFLRTFVNAHGSAKYFRRHMNEFEMQYLQDLLDLRIEDEKREFYNVCIPIKIFQIIGDMAKLNVKKIYKYIYNNKTVQLLIRYLVHPEWTWKQDFILSLIHTISLNASVCQNILESDELQFFLEFSKTASPAHREACMNIIIAYCEAPDGVINAIKTELYRELEYYYHYPDKNVELKVLRITAKILKWHRTYREIITENLLNYFVEIYTDKKLPSEFRTIVMDFLEVFVYTKDTLPLFIKFGFFKAMNVLIVRNNVEDKNILKRIFSFIYLMASKVNESHPYLFTLEKAYKSYVNILKNPNEFLSKLLYILKRTMYIDAYRKWFLEVNPSKSIQRLVDLYAKRSIRANTLGRKVCDFIATCCEVTNDMVYYFHSILKGRFDSSANLHGFLRGMHKKDISLKFFDTGYLSQYDIIDIGFRVNLRGTPYTFPNPKYTWLKGICETYPVIYVDWLKPEVINSHTQQFKHYLSESIEMEGIRILNEHGVYTVRLRDKRYDNLKEFLMFTVPSLENESNIVSKVKFLADFVQVKLSKRIVYPLRKPLIIHQVPYLGDLVKIWPDYSPFNPKMYDRYKDQLQHLKQIHGIHPIPLSEIMLGSVNEKSVLFKALADHCDIPCSLHRNSGGMIWVEVPIIFELPKPFAYFEKKVIRLSYVVDLIDNIGKLIPRGDVKTEQYISNAHHLNNSIRFHENDVLVRNKKLLIRPENDPYYFNAY